jgi:hypothetical protein
MSGWLPPGCTDADIDRAAQNPNAVQCDNCQSMFSPDEEGCFIGYHASYGDCCQCAKCVETARGDFPR